MPRVAGCDPGTSSLDVLVLDEGIVREQVRFPAHELRADPTAPIRWLQAHSPYDLIAGPSGYGLPLISARDCGEHEIDLMTLVRPDERGHSQGVRGFSALLRALIGSNLPVVFLPGVVHLPTVPAHRKINRIDMGTPDKVSVGALAWELNPRDSFALVEMGSSFTAILVVADGEIVDGVGGTSGPMGWRSSGAWDGELAYLLSPLTKHDLFSGGGFDVPDRDLARRAFIESLVKAIAGLRTINQFELVILSGRLIAVEPTLVQDLRERLGTTTMLDSLPGAWVKTAAQGAALIADSLAGGASSVADMFRLRDASGSVWDHIIPASRRPSSTDR